MRRRGFTLIEVLTTLALMALVLPAIMQGISMSSAVADSSRRRTEAAGLAQMEMAQILASQSWQNGATSGDFNPDWPDYSWDCEANSWTGDLEGAGIDDLELTVKWKERGHDKSLTLSSLAYLRQPASSSTSGSSTGGGTGGGGTKTTGTGGKG